MTAVTYETDVLIIDAGDGSVSHPKASTIGPRSMELFRRWGVADKIRNAGWPGSYLLDIAWVTKVGGHEVYRLDRGTAENRSLPERTPEPDQICPAHWLTPLLVRKVGKHPDGPFRDLAPQPSCTSTPSSWYAQTGMSHGAATTCH